MTLPQIIGLTVGILTILGTIVALTVHITKLQAEIQKGKLERNLDSLKEKYSEVEGKYLELKTKQQEIFAMGGVIAGKKNAIDVELANMSDALEASSSSILIPVPSEIEEESKELVFLSLLGAGSEKLKGLRVPMSSIAGDVFTTKKSRIIHAPLKESNVSAKTDEVADIHTNEMLAVPLIYKSKCVGVIEFLNKVGNKQFDERDQQRIERLIGSVSAKVGEFIQDPNNFGLLGITPKTRATEATILFSDVSKSMMLFKLLDTSAVIDFLNEYFEALCSIAIQHGGRIDKFLGDGFMATFNVLHAIPQHEFEASIAAIEMQDEFDNIKRKWKIFNIPDVYNRIGIDCGPVRKAEVGHSLTRQLTVMGEVVNRASNLCESGVRDRNVIIMGDTISKKMSTRLVLTEVQTQESTGTKLGNLKRYEVLSRKQ
jgi:class 3 adenylate cyclase